MKSDADNVARQLTGTREANDAFAFLNTGKSVLCQAILRVFIESRQRYAIRLRPQDVCDGIRLAGLFEMAEMPAQIEIESALAQLCEWGNLQSHPDTTTACTVEDFYNPPHTFKLTCQGEAAAKAFASYAANASLETRFQGSGLADIRFVLEELRQQSREPGPNAGSVHRSLLLLGVLLLNLSESAQTLMEKLDARMDVQLPEVRRLIEYGQLFIAELELESNGIGGMVCEMEADGLDRLLQAASERSIRKSMDATPEAVADACSHWRMHWERFRSWFVSQPGLPSNAERLSACARASLSALLRIVAGFDDQRIHRIDRASDFRVLARWFAQAGSDAEAHILWRAAFGLCSARHLGINDETLDEREAQEIPAGTSWLDAPPLLLSTRPEDYRGGSRTGALSRIIDRTAEKEKLVAATREEAQRLLSAQRRFGTGNRIRLSELEHLETGEFELFLDLLGEAVSARVSPSEAVEILSGDGCLKVRLEPTGDHREALILTTEGMFMGPDQWISIEQISTQDLPEVVA